MNTPTSLTQRLPWWAKVAAKLLLSKLPIPYGFWARLNLFKHGRMESPEYAVPVFRKHFDRASFGRKDGGFVMLELGPGDSIATGIIARAFGAEQTYLIDAGPFAHADIATYQTLIEYLRQAGYGHLPSEVPHSFEALLETFGIRYLTNGLSSLAAVPSASVDFAWSNAVYEHIRAGEIEATTREIRRVMRPDGAVSHTIDLKDHLGGGLNNLRFSRSFWEAEWVASAGFYTNRLRSADHLALFGAAGFRVEMASERRWAALPIRREHLAPEFQSCGADDLLVSGLDVVLRPVPTAQVESNVA